MEIVNCLIPRLDTQLKNINDLVLDGSYFKDPVLIPGVASTYEPYDAPNGALCVNFNTVNFRRDKNGAYVSAETQTPLLPFVLSR
ncbi:D-alanyl-D-alanine carboxypeptidase, partial [Desulfobacteraceae bacterium SEEP-SAG10]